MVGALADWFAVTALFRHPLGLPIPHTAIIPRRKDAIGESLSEFVATNFLSEAVVRDRLAAVLHRAAGRRVPGPSPSPRERVTSELATAVRGISNVLSDDQVADLLETMARRKIAETKIGPPLGPDRGRGVRARRSPSARRLHRRPLLRVDPRQLHGRLPGGLAARAVLVAEVPRLRSSPTGSTTRSRRSRWPSKTDPDHQLRQALDRFLAEFAQDLQTDPATIERAENGQGPDRRATPRSARWPPARGRRSRTRSCRPPRTRLAAAPSVTEGLISFGRQLEPTATDGGQGRRLGRRRRRLHRPQPRPSRSPASSTRPSPAGTARRPAARSSCRSVATCSSSGSTARSSARWPAW